LRTKLLVVVSSIISFFLSHYFKNYLIFIPFAVFSVHLLYGLLKSITLSRDPLNEIPNSVRVLFGSISGVLIVNMDFLDITLSFFFFVAGILLNDEYQRRAFSSLRKKRFGGSVALLGIDGSGKTTHSRYMAEWFNKRGYYTSLVPFHRYLFVERLSRKKNKNSNVAIGKGNPLRPIASLLDNIVFLIATSFGSYIEGRVVIYDRYIWSTYIKYEALGYPVKPLHTLYMLFRPRFALILDVPVQRSLEVIRARPEHIRYTERILSHERESYLMIAKKQSYPVIDSTKDFTTVQTEIERYLSRVFPDAN